MGSLINLLIYLIILCLILGVVYWVLQQIPMPEPFGRIVKVAFGLIVILVLLSMVFGGINLPTLRLG